MKFQIDPKDLERVEFPDSEWVDLRKELTQKARDRISGKMISTRQGDKTTVEIGLGRLPTYVEYIAAWSFKDGDTPIPVTEDSIDSLPSKYLYLISQRINELTAKAGEFSKN